MTGDRTESKSVNTSSQWGTRHPKGQCVAALAIRTEEKGLSYPGAGPHPTELLRPFIYLFLLKQSTSTQGRIYRGDERDWTPSEAEKLNKK